jgi:hypothetical protein
MTYEQLRERLRQRHSRKRATVLVAAAVVGVVSLLGLVWLGLSEDAAGLRSPAGPLSAARGERVEGAIACPSSSPAAGQSPEVTVLAFASLRPTLP